MPKRFNKITIPAAFLTLALSAGGQNKFADVTVKSAQGILWTDPADIASRSLFYGSGGKDHQPAGTDFTFVDEDLDGSNPKYNVKASDGVKWKIKLGAEAQPETAATRLVWAVGYSTNEDYFLPLVHVTELPAHLKRGQSMIGPGAGEMHNVRLKRHLKGEENAGFWSWHDPLLEGTREWNGLRVMMAVINNWDLKDDNNAVYEDGPNRVYMVKDLGASFGTTGFNPQQDTSKGNLYNYQHSHFITKTTKDYVDFGIPSRPALYVFFNPIETKQRIDLRWIGKHIPRSDARWMGQMLAKLSPGQIRDAFRAAGYSPEDTEAFAKVVEKRINELTAL